MVAPAGMVTVPVNVGLLIGAREVSVGCTWSPRAYVANTPVAAAPSMIGVVEDATGTCAMTKAVVAICVVLVPTVAVGASGMPVKLGDAIGAAPSSVITCATVRSAAFAVAPVLLPFSVLVAICAASALVMPLVATLTVTAPVPPPVRPVPAVTPVARPDTTLCTRAVVAICVVLVVEIGVGAAGMPVNVGEASGA